MNKSEIYKEAYKLFEETYHIAEEANFLSLEELKRLSGNASRVYAQIVPEEVRNSFPLKIQDLEEVLEARASAERIIAASMVRF